MGFFIVANSIWLVLHIYVGQRLIAGSRLPVPWNYAAWGLWALLLVIGPLAMASNRLLERSAWTPALQWGGYVYMGFFLMLFPLVMVSDAGRLLWWGKAKLAHAAEIPGLPENPERRLALTRALNGGMVGVTALLTGVGFHRARIAPDILRVTVPIRDLPAGLEGFRIALLSDIHIGPTIKGPFARTVADLTNRETPDLVAITGDLVDGHVHDLAGHVAPLGDIRAKYGCFYVTGNHEYYWDSDGWLREVERLGYTALVNEHRVVEVNGASLTVAGVTDVSAHRMRPEHRSDPVAALKGTPAGSFKLMLAHQPKSAFDAAAAGAQLQLSGHTHGGQFVPWTWLIHHVQPVGAGLHELAGMPIYVSRGTGYWGPPNRAGSPSEITILTLTKSAAMVS